MTNKIVASRLADGNKIFPPSITLEDNGLTLKIPGFKSKKMFFYYKDISSVSVNSSMIGYSTIHINAQGTRFSAHGFKKKEVEKIKAIIDENRGKGISDSTTSSNKKSKDKSKPKTGVMDLIAKQMESAAKEEEEDRKEEEEEREEKRRIDEKVDEISFMTFSKDADDIESQLNQLMSLLSSKPKKKLKNVFIEKIEFGILKLRKAGANDEASYFEDKLAPYKKKNIFGF